MKRRFPTFSILLVTFLLMASCRSLGGLTELPRAGVSAEWAAATDAFLEQAQTVKDPDTADPFSIMVVDKGKVVFERWWGGYAPESLFEVFSISKAFTAIAAGMAVDEGLFSVDDKVIDFFPEQLPEVVSDTLSAMTIGHLLTMTCGMKETEELLAVFSGKDQLDWAEAFFRSHQASMPGTDFYYNFFSPYIVSAIIQKTSGTTLLDFLKPRLLDPLHITDMQWDSSPQGICVGGWGMRLSTEDMAKIGLFMVQGGKWNHRRLVSSKWMETMTSKLVESGPFSAYSKNSSIINPDGTPEDHSLGYGYYVWQGQMGTWRLEGLQGQYVIIQPDKARVLAVTSKTNMDARYIQMIFKHFGHLLTR